MAFPFGALFDPALDQFDLGRRKSGTILRFGHQVVRIMRSDAEKKFALLQTVRSDGMPALDFAEQTILRVEAQICFARIFVGAVTGVTIVRQDGTDVAIELDGFWQRSSEGEAGGRQRRESNPNRGKNPVKVQSSIGPRRRQIPYFEAEIAPSGKSGNSVRGPVR